ncbi:uncharacterized protein METZ01_LOCUS15306 [marine metagenome]|uniref:Uncharacterized protein n=1 Tax=marine metagenome TaxID=408172 RepID=A0A381P6A5_9ZZZZ
MPGMKTPEGISLKSPGGYLETMNKVVFQSRMSSKIVKPQWPCAREAFHDFDAAKVGGVTPSEIGG